ncbi:hypothetical protein I3842_03G251000 [Carya illinoinensis]|uniref:Uncharacterized protein n=1 Tax=Carya illinoinensis TaxID=32201 RepID=A0A922FNZ5_CARIL|nr:hypothetical protein I3842_03G251000 [Carya illinoinensis]
MAFECISWVRWKAPLHNRRRLARRKLCSEASEFLPMESSPWVLAAAERAKQ